MINVIIPNVGLCVRQQAKSGRPFASICTILWQTKYIPRPMHLRSVVACSPCYCAKRSPQTVHTLCIYDADEARIEESREPLPTGRNPLKTLEGRKTVATETAYHICIKSDWFFFNLLYVVCICLEHWVSHR